MGANVRATFAPNYFFSPLNRDATIGLATMEVDVTKWGPRTKSSELSAAEADTLASWVARFRAKYQVVGFLNDGANPTTVAMAAAKGLLKA